MKPLTGKDLTRVLEGSGWKLLRVHGSHHIYGREGSPIRISVPIHGNAELKRGLLLHMLKMAGLKESDLP